jgi:hypothetical protein
MSMYPPWIEDIQRQGIADGVGLLRLEFGGPPMWREWQVTGLIVDSNGALNPTATAYKNSQNPNNIVAFTRLGRRDTGRGRILIQAGEIIFVLFEGASPASKCTATLTLNNTPSKRT